MTDTVVYSQDGHVGTLLLNNPARHNALGREQLDAIMRVLDHVATDDAVRALMVTGAGEKTFCAGASLAELSAGEMGDDAFQRMTASLAALRIPTICALNGNVFGGGVELAVSCDFRIGIEGMRMRVPAAALGLCYPPDGIERFVQCLGVSVTRRVLMAAEEFQAQEMLQIGFLDHLVLADELQGRAQEYAAAVAALAPLAVQNMKQVLRQAASGGIDPESARELADACLQSEDLQEGFAAQRDKRPPSFRRR